MAIIKKLLKCLTLLLYVVFFVFVLGFVLLNSDRFYQSFVTRWVKTSLPEVRLDHIYLHDSTFRLPDTFRFKKVDIAVHRGEERFAVVFKDVRLDQLFGFLLNQASVEFQAMLSSFESPALLINTAHMNIRAKQSQQNEINFTGTVNADKIVVGDYQLNQSAIDIFGSPKHLEAKLTNSKFYEGELQAEIIIELQESNPFDVKSKFAGINPALAFPSVASNFEGYVDGVIEFTGNDHQAIVSIKGDIVLVPGAKIRGWIIGWLLELLPEKEKYFSDSLMIAVQNNDPIPVDRAHVKINNSGQGLIQANIEMFCKKYNFNLDYDFDIPNVHDLNMALTSFEKLLKTGSHR